MGSYKPNYKLKNVMTPEHSSAEAIQQMQNHVDSYNSLSRHRHNCLELCRRLSEAEATIGRIEAALEFEDCHEWCGKSPRKDSDGRCGICVAKQALEQQE